MGIVQRKPSRSLHSPLFTLHSSLFTLVLRQMNNLHTLNRLVYECFNVEVALCLEDLRHLRLGIRVLRGKYGAAVLVGEDGGLEGVDLTTINGGNSK